MTKKDDQHQPPNFTKSGRLYLIRCFKCVPEYGKENWAPYVASGQCAWCGWKQGKNKC